LKSKVFTVAASGLSFSASGTALITEVDVTLNVTSYTYDNTEVEENLNYYPKQIIIDNNSNATIGYITLSDEREYSIYQQHPDWFDFIPIRSKVMVNALVSSKTVKILIKALQEDITYINDPTIICIGYIRP